MNKPHPTIVETGGDDVVVLTRREYDVLLARLGDEAAEDRMTLRLLDDARDEPPMPSWLSDAIINGQMPLHAARKRAGLTQAAVASKLGITQGYYSELESGSKAGSGETLARLAALFGVDAGLLQFKDD